MHSFVDQRAVACLYGVEHQSRLMSWRERVEVYGVRLRYIKGELNPADFLSRYAQAKKDKEGWDLMQGYEEAIAKDPLIKALEESKGEKNSAEGCIFKSQGFTKEGFLFLYLNKIVVPKNSRRNLVRRMHWEDPGHAHQGVVRTLMALKKSYHWMNMQREVEEVVASCQVCTRVKQTAIRAPILNLPVPERKFLNIQIDSFGYGSLPEFKGRRVALVMIDRVSGWCEIYPWKRKSGEVIASTLFCEWFCRFGFPRVIYGNNGKVFTDGEMKKMFLDNGIKFMSCESNDHSQNEHVEKTIRFVNEQLRICFMENRIKSKWPKMIKVIAWKHNCNWVRRLNETPFKVVIGRKPVGKYDERIEALQLGEKEMEVLEKVCNKLRGERKRKSKEEGKEV